MIGKNGMRGGLVARWSSRYFAMLWNGFMTIISSWNGNEGIHTVRQLVIMPFTLHNSPPLVDDDDEALSPTMS